MLENLQVLLENIQVLLVMNILLFAGKNTINKLWLSLDLSAKSDLRLTNFISFRPEPKPPSENFVSSDEVNELHIMRMMARPAYILSCYTTVAIK